MKYIYKNENEIIRISDRLYKYKLKSDAIMYANEDDKPITIYKDLIIEELIAYFEDGDVIRKKYRIINKEHLNE